MNFVSPEYFTPEGLIELKESVDVVPKAELSETLDQRLARATENFIEIISDPAAPQEEIDYATLELATLAQADEFLNSGSQDLANSLGWITTARQAILDAWDRVYQEDPKIPVESTIFFDSSLGTQIDLHAAAYNLQSPKIPDEQWDPYYHGAGLALGKIGLITSPEE